MLSDKLKADTKINHQVLERKLIASIKAISTEQDYIEILLTFYRYFGGLEIAIEKHLDMSLLPDYKQRRKITSLANDIHFLNSVLPAFVESDSLPQIQNHAQALGALYVIEGSTLGGKYISKMISQQIQIGEKGLSFFEGYGNQTEEMWELFKQSIDTPSQAIYEKLIVQSANETFLKFSEWIDKG